MREDRNFFRCKGQDGRAVTVVERVEMTTFRPLSGPAKKLPGALDYVLAPQDGGGDVNWLDDTRFQVVATDEVLTRID